jgi:DNA-directed RNA polymerase subunit RPC12/RpoP
MPETGKVSRGETPSGSLAEPRIACPRCGAHLLVLADSDDDGTSVLCPVCAFKGRTEGGHIEPTD